LDGQASSTMEQRLGDGSVLVIYWLVVVFKSRYTFGRVPGFVTSLSVFNNNRDDSNFRSNCR
jgi:hypothetical protein